MPPKKGKQQPKNSSAPKPKEGGKGKDAKAAGGKKTATKGTGFLPGEYRPG